MTELVWVPWVIIMNKDKETPCTPYYCDMQYWTITYFGAETMRKKEKFIRIVLSLCLLVALSTFSACVDTVTNGSNGSGAGTSNGAGTGNGTGTGNGAGAGTNGQDGQDGQTTGDPGLSTSGSENGSSSSQTGNGAEVTLVHVPSANLISPQQVHGLPATARVKIVDTRTLADFIEGSVPGAISIPLRLLERRFAEIPENAQVIFIAYSEEEMSQAYSLMLHLGYQDKNLSFLEGGFEAWHAAGYEIQITEDVTFC